MGSVQKWNGAAKDVLAGNEVTGELPLVGRPGSDTRRLAEHMRRTEPKYYAAFVDGYLSGGTKKPKGLSL